MNQIENIGLSAMHNSEHYQFMYEFRQSVMAHTTLGKSIAKFLPLFDEALVVESTTMRVPQKSDLTDNLSRLAENRSKTKKSIDATIRGLLKSPFPEVEASAQVVAVIINNLKPGSASQSAYSASYTNITQALLEPENDEHLTRLNLKETVKALASQNDEYIQLNSLRNTSYSVQKSGDVRKARLATDTIYQQIVSTVNAMTVLGVENDAAAPFINEINSRIKSYRKVLAVRKSRKGKNKAEETDGAGEMVSEV